MNADGGNVAARHDVAGHRHRGARSRPTASRSCSRPTAAARRRSTGCNLGSGAVERMTFDGSYNVSPRPLPDGKGFVFVRRDGGRFQIAIAWTIATRQVQVLTAGPGRRKPERRAQRQAHHLRERVGGPWYIGRGLQRRSRQAAARRARRPMCASPHGVRFAAVHEAFNFDARPVAARTHFKQEAHAQVPLAALVAVVTRRLLRRTPTTGPGRRQVGADRRRPPPAPTRAHDRRRPAAAASTGSAPARRAGRSAARSRTTSCPSAASTSTTTASSSSDEFKPLVEAHAQVPAAQPQRADDAPGQHRRARLARIQHRARPEARRRGQAHDDCCSAPAKCQIETVSFGKEKPQQPGPRRSGVGREPPRRHRLRRRVDRLTRSLRAMRRCVVRWRCVACVRARAPRTRRSSTTTRRASASRRPTTRLDAVQRQLEDRARRARAAAQEPGPGRPVQRRSSSMQVRHRAAARPDRGADLRARAGAEAPARSVRRPRLALRKMRRRRRRAPRAPAPRRRALRRRRAAGRVANAPQRRPRPPAPPPPVAAAPAAPRSRRRRAARVRRRARPVQARRLRRRDRELRQLREDVSAQPARVVGAVLGRQRAVRAQGLPRGDRRAAHADRGLSGQPQGAGRAAQHRVGAVRAGRQRGGAAHARGADRASTRSPRRRQGAAAARHPADSESVRVRRSRVEPGRS